MAWIRLSVARRLSSTRRLPRFHFRFRYDVRAQRMGRGCPGRARVWLPQRRQSGTPKNRRHFDHTRARHKRHYTRRQPGLEDGPARRERPEDGRGERLTDEERRWLEAQNQYLPEAGGRAPGAGHLGCRARVADAGHISNAGGGT